MPTSAGVIGIRPKRLMLALRMSRMKVRSGKPSLPFGRPAGSTSTTTKPSVVRSHGMSDAKMRSWCAYSPCTVMLPRPSAKFWPYIAETYWFAAEACAAMSPPGREPGGPSKSRLQDEVDDAGDGVRTVHRRVAAGDDVDALDQVVRDGVDVGRHGVVENVGGDVAAAVDQHQGADRAEAAKVEQVEAGDADAEARVLLGEGAAQLRQLVERVADVGLPLLEELLAADRGDRNRAIRGSGGGCASR